MDECESEESSGKEMWLLLLKGDTERLENYINSHMKDVAEMLLYEDSTNGHETNTCIELFIKKSEDVKWRELLLERILEKVPASTQEQIITSCDLKGRNALHWAVRFNNMPVVQAFLGLLPKHLQTKAIEQPDTWGRNSIQWALRLNHSDILSLLVNYIGLKSQASSPAKHFIAKT
ncbi:uncharacterized protein [Watersipora subatra]|uniref:uncharacterized protein n=1 Tax=Watersipora subatra TaxID=2589382 RepID=UPI00355B3A12